jgi:hypothetical protein
MACTARDPDTAAKRARRLLKEGAFASAPVREGAASCIRCLTRGKDGKVVVEIDPLVCDTFDPPRDRKKE